MFGQLFFYLILLLNLLIMVLNKVKYTIKLGMLQGTDVVGHMQLRRKLLFFTQ